MLYSGLLLASTFLFFSRSITLLIRHRVSQSNQSSLDFGYWFLITSFAPSSFSFTHSRHFSLSLSLHLSLSLSSSLHGHRVNILEHLLLLSALFRFHVYLFPVAKYINHIEQILERCETRHRSTLVMLVATNVSMLRNKGGMTTTLYEP
jgi:hypothetical protein